MGIEMLALSGGHTGISTIEVKWTKVIDKLDYMAAQFPHAGA